MEEFQLFHVGGALQQILPRCYGVAKCTIGQITYDLLFAERIAFTVEELFQKLQREAPNGYNGCSSYLMLRKKNRYPYLVRLQLSKKQQFIEFCLSRDSHAC